MIDVTYIVDAAPPWHEWTASDHVGEAERLVHEWRRHGKPTMITPVALTLAQVHATIAVAKASRP